MSWLDLLALGPHLILAFGATALLLLGAWFREPRPLLTGGVLVALMAALTAGLYPPPVIEIAGLFSAGPFARFFTVFWPLTAALGLMVGKTLLLGSGNGLDLSIGAYDLVEKPEGGSDWQIKFGISLFFN